MEDFATKLVNDIQHSILKEVVSAKWLNIKYEDKKQIPQEFVDKAWANVNWESVLDNVTQHLETRICNAVVGGMETELKTDVKKLLSVSGVREKLRMSVYPELMKVLDNR